MIIVVDGVNRHRFGALLEDMFRLRARVFGDRLGWEVKIEDGLEIDRFDALGPAYVIGLDEDGHVVSCVRALQTTGPHMLADVFSDILDGEPPLRSATLWESTRFCVDTARLRGGQGRGSISHATCELMIGSLEFCRNSGIEDIVTVIDPVIDRILKRSNNAPYDYVGTAKPMGKVTAMAALLDCSEERIARVRAFAGIDGPVLLDDDAALELLARNTVTRLAPTVEQRVTALRNPEILTDAAVQEAPTSLPSSVRAERAHESGPSSIVAVRPDKLVEELSTAEDTRALMQLAALLPPPTSQVTVADLYAYCAEQIEATRTVQEREVALSLVRVVLNQVPARQGWKGFVN